MKAGNFDMVFNICWGMLMILSGKLLRAPVWRLRCTAGTGDKAEIDQAITDILTSHR